MKARRFRSVLVILLALGGLTSCRSIPSAKRVAFDVIDTLDNLTAAERECMRVKVDAYTEDELKTIADGADKDPPDPESQAALDKFEADLADCRTSS